MMGERNMELLEDTESWERFELVRLAIFAPV
jgi:hypothetical protein